MHGELEITKYRLIHSIGQESLDLYLPYYFNVSDLNKDKESYRERFNSEERYQRFLKKQYPVIAWMLDHGMEEENKVFKW